MPVSEPTQSAPEGQPTRASRQRYQPRHRSRWERIPLSLKLLFPLLVIGGGFGGYRMWKASHAVLIFERAGASLGPLELSVFDDRFSYSALSPAPALVELSCEGDEFLLSRDLVGDSAFVRYRGEGVGAGYVRVRTGDEQVVRLAPPANVSGRVVVPDAAMIFGVRNLATRGVAGALVQGFGGGEHGVLLCEATTDADGSFQLEGFDSSLPSIGIRVLAAGHSRLFTYWAPGTPDPVLALATTEALHGRVLLPEGVATAGLRVLARGLPGIQAEVLVDGRFTLDHVPMGLQPRLLLSGLPPTFTHRMCRSCAGDEDAEIEVVPAAHVRGWVVDLATQQPLTDAIVWHAHGADGRVTVTTRADGSFELAAVPPGEVLLTAQHDSTDRLGQKTSMGGERWVRVEAGKDLEQIIIRLN
jgi:hypothetical protein